MNKQQAKKIIKQNKEVYNKIASHFSNTRSYLWDDLKPLRDYVKNGDRVLDLGCGNGRLYQLFSGLSITYVGLDQSEELIKIARSHVPEAEFVVHDMTELPFPDDSFDIIYCIAALQHIPKEELRLQTLREMKRVLCPGGWVVMTNWNLHSAEVKKKAEIRNWTYSPVGITSLYGKLEIGKYEFLVPWLNDRGEVLGKRYYHGFTIEELEELFLAAGFEVAEQYYTSKGKKSSKQEPGNIVSLLFSCYEGLYSIAR